MRRSKRRWGNGSTLNGSDWVNMSYYGLHNFLCSIVGWWLSSSKSSWIIIVDGIIRSDWFYLKDGQWTGSFGWGDVEWASLNELEQDNEIIWTCVSQIPIGLDIWIKCDGRKLCVYSSWLLMNNSVLFGYLIIEWIEKSWKGPVNWKWWKNGILQRGESNPIIIL